jgi:predicted small metal-binding protein
MAQEKYSIRCIEIGDVDCPWVGHGNDEEELMGEVERHGRENHKWASISEETKNKVRGAIRKTAA